jgi:catechol 2,3-dioxygenase-like lactoylglutathione lyase family enzyme
MSSPTRSVFSRVPINHIGYVVSDIEEAVSWAVKTFGAGPFFLMPHMPFEVCTFNGAAAEYDHSSAFGQWGEIRIELTVVHGAKPAELGELIGGNPPRVGHVGLIVDNLEAESAALEAAGMPLFHTGATGPVAAHWHDARARLGHHIELLRRFPGLEAAQATFRAAADDWDGIDPLRVARPGGDH